MEHFRRWTKWILLSAHFLGNLAFAVGEDSASYLQARLRAENSPVLLQFLAQSAASSPDALRQEILQSRCSLLLTRISKAQAETSSLKIERVSAKGVREYFDPQEQIGMDSWVAHALQPSPFLAPKISKNAQAKHIVRVARYFWMSFSMGQMPDSSIWESELGQEVGNRMIAYLIRADHARLKNIFSYSQSQEGDQASERRILAMESFAPLSKMVQMWNAGRLRDAELLAFALKDDFFLGALKRDFLVRFSRVVRAQLALSPAQAVLLPWARYVAAMANALQNSTAPGAQGELLVAEAALKGLN